MGMQTYFKTQLPWFTKLLDKTDLVRKHEVSDICLLFMWYLNILVNSVLVNQNGIRSVFLIVNHYMEKMNKLKGELNKTDS